MNRNPEQTIIGRFALWVRDIDPSKPYWLLLFTDYGIYDDEEPNIHNLVEAYSGKHPFTDLGIFSPQSRTEVTLETFLWLYSEDRELCFQIMKHIYEDFKDDEDAPQPYDPVHKLEEFEQGEQYPEIDEGELVSAAPQVIKEDSEFEFYQRVKPHFEKAKDEVFLVDPYVDHEAIELYLSETSDGLDRRILTQSPEGKFNEVAKKFIKDGRDIEVRATPKCHDRLIFIDDACFIVGISIKDAGSNPNYLVELDSVDHFRRPWEQMWHEADEYTISS